MGLKAADENGGRAAVRRARADHPSFAGSRSTFRSGLVKAPQPDCVERSVAVGDTVLGSVPPEDKEPSANSGVWGDAGNSLSC